jgi:hypothetical protein
MVEQAYARSEWQTVLDALDRAKLPWLDDQERADDRRRVQIAILRLARGSTTRLTEQLAAAGVDFRDTLMCAGLEEANWKEVVDQTPWEHVPCARCEELHVRYEIRAPSELEAALRIVRAHVADGTLTVLRSADGTWDVCMRDDVALPDIVDATLQCRACQREFRLVAEVYHGAGGSWCCSRGATQPGVGSSPS